MAYNFPNSPTLNQVFPAPGGPVYTWNGTAWTTGGTQSVIASDAPPASPVVGQLWWDSDLGVLFVYFDGFWVQVGGFSTEIYGDYLTVTGSAVSITSAAASKNICSVTLTPGDWDVSCAAVFVGAPAAAQTIWVGINTTSAAMPAVGVNSVQTSFGTYTSLYSLNMAVPPCRFSVAVNTPVYVIGYATFNAGTATMTATINARRWR